MIRFWNRLINMRDSRLTKQVFLADFNQNSNNWCSEIEQIFDSVNCLSIFQERHTCDLLSFESKLKFNLQNEWHNEINKKPELRTYVHFKNIFKTDNYVSAYMLRPHRSLLAQLRSGILPLRLETGRFQNIRDENTGHFRKLKVEERVCTLCNLNYIKDEIHFVLVHVCPKYAQIRSPLLDLLLQKYDHFVDLSNLDKLSFLINYAFKLLARYLYDAWNIRKLNIYG